MGKMLLIFPSVVDLVRAEVSDCLEDLLVQHCQQWILIVLRQASCIRGTVGNSVVMEVNLKI